MVGATLTEVEGRPLLGHGFQADTLMPMGSSSHREAAGCKSDVRQWTIWLSWNLQFVPVTLRFAWRPLRRDRPAGGMWSLMDSPVDEDRIEAMVHIRGGLDEAREKLLALEESSGTLVFKERGLGCDTLDVPQGGAKFGLWLHPWGLLRSVTGKRW